MKSFLNIAATVSLALMFTACAAPSSAQPAAISASATVPPIPLVPTARRPARVGPTLEPAPLPAPVADAQPVSAYILDVTLDYEGKRLDVEQEISTNNRTADTWHDLVFAVLPNAIVDVFELRDVTVIDESSQQIVEAGLDEGEVFLRVLLPDPVAPGESVTLALSYSMFPPQLALTDWQPVSAFAYSDNLFQAGEWYAVLVPYIEGEGWLTWRYHPVGDPIIYPLADYELTISAPSDLTIASGGPLVESPAAQGGNTVWQFRIENARAPGFIASPNYRCLTRRWQDVDLTSCFHPEHDIAGRTALDITQQAIALFSELFGPYQYSELVLAENGYFGAMEYSGMLSISRPAYSLYNGRSDSLLTTLVVHEVAHQWWYGMVGNNQILEPWLDEALATYSELLYYERYHPDLGAWWWNFEVLRYDPSGPVDATIYDYSLTEPFVRNTYGQASFFLQDLRTLMGDDAFFAFLRDYFNSNAYQIASADDFFAAVRRHTDADLTPLLRGYFGNPDH